MFWELIGKVKRCVGIDVEVSLKKLNGVPE
jgi:hypothetical protein